MAAVRDGRLPGDGGVVPPGSAVDSPTTLSSGSDLTPMKAATVVNAVRIALSTAVNGATPAVRVAGTGETSLSSPSDHGKETVRVKVCAVLCRGWRLGLATACYPIRPPTSPGLCVCPRRSTIGVCLHAGTLTHCSSLIRTHILVMLPFQCAAVLLWRLHACASPFAGCGVRWGCGA